jgi:polysaccharide export outer membrane protein
MAPSDAAPRGPIEPHPATECPASECSTSDLRCGVDCRDGCGCQGLGWEAARLIQWQRYAQGEYVGPARARHVEEYRLRVDDELDLVYRLTREEQPNPYRLNVGDEVRVESATDRDLDRDLILQPDGTITLRLLGQVRATGLTVPQLREEVEKLYTKYYKVPAITVSPLRVNSKLDDLRNAVDARFGQGGQNRAARVTPDGTISLPAVGVVQAQGLTLQELRVELREAYRREVEGIEVIPVLVNRAPRFVYVLGEVALPGRYELTGPTTVLQAIAMAGSWNVGAHIRQVVVLRRGDDWQLMATKLDLRPALYGRDPCPRDEIWISDSDIVIVPKNPILVADEFIEMVFTRGIYGVFPMYTTLNFAKASTL